MVLWLMVVGTPVRNHTPVRENEIELNYPFYYGYLHSYQLVVVPPRGSVKAISY